MVKSFFQLSVFFFLTIFYDQSANAQNQASQFSGTGQFIQSGIIDAGLLGKAYLAPVFNGLGSGFNQGWASSAKVKIGQVNLKFLGGLSFVSPVDQFFDATTLGLSSNIQINGSGISPTLTGSKNQGAELDIYSQNPKTGNAQLINSFNSPEGLGLNFVPFVIPQLSVGLPYNTEISVRLVPNVPVGNYKVGIYGGAFKHEISSYIPLSPIDISFLAGYTRSNVSYGLNVQPDPNAQNNTGGDYSNQVLNLKSSSLLIGLIASKKLSVLTVHIGINYNHISGLLSAIGTYPVDSFGPLGNRQVVNEQDPIKINSDPLSFFSANGGLQLKLGFFSVFADGSLGNYNTVTGGVGFTF